MNLNNFKLLKEDGDKYHLSSPSGKKFTVAKHELTDKAHEVIKKLKPKKMAEGGEVVRAPASAEDPGSHQPPEPVEHHWYDSVVNGAKDVGNWISDHSPSIPEAVASTVAPNAYNAYKALNYLDQASKPAAPAAPQDNQLQYSTPPPAEAQGPDPLVGQRNELRDLYNQEEKQAQNYAGSVGAAGAQEAKAYGDLANQLGAMKTPLQHAEEFNAKDEAFTQQYAQQKVDPNRLYHNMSTGSKVLSAISLVLGGIGASFTGKNPALEVMQDAINKDVDAQKNDQDKGLNLWRMNQAAYHNDQQATIATTNQLLSVAQAKAMQAAAMAKTPAARLAAQQLIDQIKEKKINNNFMQGMLSAKGQPQQGGQPSNLLAADPSYLVESMVSDPAAKKQVYGEIQAAQNTNRMGKAIMDAFEQAVKDNTVLKTGAGLIRTPGSVLALHQNMQPTFADLEGTVRQAAMDNTFKNITPEPGDMDSTTDTKRKALAHYLQSKSSAPTAKGHGIDLNKFQSTAPYAPQQTATVNGQNFVKVPGGWQRVK